MCHGYYQTFPEKKERIWNMMKHIISVVLFFDNTVLWQRIEND